MATVLPGSPPDFNKNDVSGTVKSLCNYTRILQENLDFLLGQMKKEITTIQENITGIQNRISTLQNSVSGIQSDLEGVESSISVQSIQIQELSDRVSALEYQGQ